MPWRSEKTNTGQDLIFDGFEFGVAPSPHKGIANIQNANISTESGEILASYGRVAQQQAAITNGTLTPDGATLFNAPANLKNGSWIKVTASTVTSVTAATDPTTVAIDYLLVGGGGGGGSASNGAGGGGGGGQVVDDSTTIAVGSYVVVVGDGGDGGGNFVEGTSGGTSSIAGVDTAAGGGAGGLGLVGANQGQLDGDNGSSGGGGGANSATGVNGTGTGGQGSDGGDGFGSGTTDLRAGGGGGGASAVGTNATSGAGGVGGAGVASSVSGTSVTYGGGGGGGNVGASGAGGVGGGGNGGPDSVGTAGTDGLGGGGGGSSDNDNVLTLGGSGGSGVVIISYETGAMTAIGGSISYVGTKTLHTFETSDTFTVVSINPGGLYYVSYELSGKIKLSSKFDPTGANVLTHGTTGSITFSTVATPAGGVAKFVEKYTTATNTEYRYSILDTNSRVWVFDTAINTAYGTQWMLPDPNDYSTLRFTGMGVLNGWLLTVGLNAIYGKPTTNLGTAYQVLTGAYLNEPFPTNNKTVLVGNQGKMYYCDGNYIGEIFATTSLVTSIANIQSNCSYTASSTTGTISAIINGSLPYDPGGVRIPAVFYTDEYGTLPTAITLNTVYFIKYDPGSATFEVYDALTGGTLINIATGATGTQYFNTFYPIGPSAGINGTDSLVQFSPQRLNLPANETSQCMVEIGNIVLIGGKTNTVYPWNQIDVTPSDFIALPESDVKVMVNVNNIAYIFAGNKGNIYVSNGSIASLALKVPDYVAGVPGTPLTYIEPYFTWGDADYMRGRVYFSILDQTATKAGNCGGVWSFIPPQNVDPSQEIGMALRLENQNSYADYDGYATLIIPNKVQNAVSPQYWTSWQDSYSVDTSVFGIDYTNTVPVTTYIVETDLLRTGTMLEKQTFAQLEYKMSSPLLSGDSVALFYRLNSTDAWVTCGTVIEESNRISGYYNQAFEKTQWLQVRAVVTTPGTTASSFGRLSEIRLR